LLRQAQVQVAKDDPGLDPYPIAAGFGDLPKKAAEIDNQTLSKGFPGQAAARASRHQGKMIGPCVLHQGLDIFFIARHDDAERFYLE
jgi:hypothetical protein